MAPAVFKTDVVEQLGQAGSIPVRLRYGRTGSGLRPRQPLAHPTRPGAHPPDDGRGRAQLGDRRRGPLGRGPEQQAAGGLRVGEQQHGRPRRSRRRRARRRPRRGCAACRPARPRPRPARGPRRERHGRDVDLGVDARGRRHLGEVPEQPEPGDVRGSRWPRPRAPRGPRARCSPSSRRPRRRQASVAAAPALIAVVATPTPSALVSTSASPSRRPVLVRIRSGCTSPTTARPYLGSGSSTLCPPTTTNPLSRRDVGPAREHLAEHVERQLVARARPRGSARTAAVRPSRRRPTPRSGAAIRPQVRGVVDDRGEEVGGRHERAAASSRQTAASSPVSVPTRRSGWRPGSGCAGPARARQVRACRLNRRRG